MKKFRRNHNLSHIKLTKSYTVEDVCQTFGVHSGTVYHWKRRGLQPIEGSYPLLFHGSNLHAFLKAEKINRTRKCEKGEFFCFKCQAPRVPVAGTVQENPKGQKIINLRAICSECGGKIFQTTSVKNMPEIYKILQTLAPPLRALVGLDTCTTNTQTEEACNGYHI